MFRRVLLAVAGIYVGFGLLLPGASMTSRYPTLADARADRLFEAGWVPDILPASSRDIRVTKDPVLAISRGEFSFVPEHYRDLVARLQPSDGNFNASLERLQQIALMRRKGFEVSGYTAADATWVFFCEPANGYCEYVRWLSTPAAHAIQE